MEPTQLYKLVKALKQIMEKDRKMTSEETTIPNHAIKNVDQFTDAYTKTLEDNTITLDEHINLTTL